MHNINQLSSGENSPFRAFTADEWAQFREDVPLTLTIEDVINLRSLGDPIELDEVRRIYLPLSRMLAIHVESMKKLYEARARFLGVNERRKSPFIIGIAGSVAVGKSTTARLLTQLLKRWPVSPKVQLITTDGFLHPNAWLEERDLMNRKGFPISYDAPRLLRFLADIKAGIGQVKAPVYSHLSYDIVPDEYQIIDQPDILVLEGINVLQTRDLPAEGQMVPFVSDFFDLSIFVDAQVENIEKWYLERFMQLWRTAFRDEKSFFNRFTGLSEDEAHKFGTQIWRDINLVNLRENILPTRPRADLILRKGPNHGVESVFVRRL